MIPITATVITFNEERNIQACLESIAWVPNIVVVDSGSNDDTVAIARRFTDRVIVTDWPGHVEQKNRAAALAGTDWILSIDADERVTPEMRDAIQDVLRDEPTHPAYSFRRKTWYLGQWILHGGWYPDRKVRLFDRRVGRWSGVNPHDHVVVHGGCNFVTTGLEKRFQFPTTIPQGIVGEDRPKRIILAKFLVGLTNVFQAHSAG